MSTSVWWHTNQTCQTPEWSSPRYRCRWWWVSFRVRSTRISPDASNSLNWPTCYRSFASRDYVHSFIYDRMYNSIFSFGHSAVR